MNSSSKVPAVPERYDAGIMSRSYSERSTRESVTSELPKSPEKSRPPFREGSGRPNRGEMSLDLEHPANNFYHEQRRKITSYGSSFHQNGGSRDRGSEIAETERFRSATRNSDFRYEHNVVSSTSNSKGFRLREERDVECLEQFGDFERIEKLSSGSSGSENYLNYDERREAVGRPSRRSRLDATANGDLTNLDALEVSNFDEGSDGAVSEAGTYTIHKDYTDEEKARMDIDRVFSVGVVTEEESSEAYVHSFKVRAFFRTASI